jgi:hypothetical protein
MKILLALVCAMMLLIPSGTAAPATQVQGSDITKNAVANPNFFIFLVVTNKPPPNGTNYIMKIGDMLQSMAVAMLNSNNTFTGSNYFSGQNYFGGSNFFQVINFPLAPYIAYTPSNNVFTGSNTFNAAYFQDMYVDRLTMTNFDLVEEPWVGPTNTINFTTNRLTYVANDSVAISGFTGTGYATLEVTNASTTNITFTLPPGVRIPVGASNPYTITNGDLLACFIEHKSLGTNSHTVVYH